jgi:hypothetical protein
VAVVGGGDSWGDSLARLLADAAASSAASERSQSRLLREVAEAEATFVGVALDLAERRAGVLLRTSSGRAHRGVILAVGRDFLVVRDPSVGAGAPAFVALSAVTSLRPQPGAGLDASGARVAPRDVGLAALLSSLAAERPRVLVGVAGGSGGGEEPVAGELRSVGVDVVTLRLDGGAGLRAHVRLGSIAEVLLLDVLVLVSKSIG